MIQKRQVYMALSILVGLASLLLAQPALACSVCFGGDPNAAMVQGVEAGLLVLLGVVGAVLMGLASLVVFWMRRAANLERLVAADERAD
jgi:hypothetical protein